MVRRVPRSAVKHMAKVPRREVRGQVASFGIVWNSPGGGGRVAGGWEGV